MQENNLEFKIIKDTNQTEIQLDNLSLISSQALLVLLDSLTKIVNSVKDKDNIRLQIKSGSAIVSAACSEDQLNSIKDDFEKVVAHDCEDENVVEGWAQLQSLISKNGLVYEVNFISNSERITVTDNFGKYKRRFKAKKQHIQIAPTLHFFEGELIENGGKVPNFHLQDSVGNEVIIECKTKAQAQKINPLLYTKIYVSAWGRYNSTTGKFIKHPLFCDYYLEEQSKEEFKQAYLKITESNLDDALTFLHERMHSYITTGEFGKARKFIRLFNHESVDLNIMKTLLIITKGLKYHNSLISVRQTLLETVEAKIGQKLP